MNAELVKQHPFLDERSGGTYAYYKVPKTMLTYGKKLGISTDETLLYTILRDRISLSVANDKIDTDGRIYVYYTRENAAACLGWSAKKASGVFKALTEHGLLVEETEYSKTTGLKTAKKLYVKLWQDVDVCFTLEDINNLNFKFATVNALQDTNMGAYYSLPIVLVEDERYQGLSLRALLLYMIILDRLATSKRCGYIDENKLLWTTVNCELVQCELGCSSRSLTRAFGELETIGLIERKQVKGANWRIYARDFAPPPLNASATPSPTPPSPQDNAPEKTIALGAVSFTDMTRQNDRSDSPNFPVGLAKFSGRSSQIFRSDSPNFPTNQLPFIQTPFYQLPSETNLLPADKPQAQGMRCSQKERAEAFLMADDIIRYDDTMSILRSKLSQSELYAATELLDECSAIIFADLLIASDYIAFATLNVKKEAAIAKYRLLKPAAIAKVIMDTAGQLEYITNLREHLHFALFNIKPTSREKLIREPQKTAEKLAQRRRQDAFLQAGAMLHDDDVMTLIYSRMDDKTVETAEGLLDECCSIVQRDLLSNVPYITLGQETVRREDVLARYNDLTGYIVYLVIEKSITQMPTVRDLRAYLHKSLYTARQKHAKEAFYLQKEFEGR